MKNIISLIVIILFSLSCKNEVKTIEVESISETTKPLDPNATYVKAEFTIDGMTCAIGCAATIQKKLAKMDGIKSAVVDFNKSLAMVEYNEKSVNPKAIEATVTKISDRYKVKDMKAVEVFSSKKK